MHAGVANKRFPFKSVAGKTFPAFPVHAQPAILRLWQEAHAVWCLPPCGTPLNRQRRLTGGCSWMHVTNGGCVLIQWHRHPNVLPFPVHTNSGQHICGNVCCCKYEHGLDGASEGTNVGYRQSAQLGVWSSYVPCVVSIIHWRHNGHDCVSNHQPHGCLLNRLFRRRSKKTSKLRVTGLCVGNSPGPVNSPHKGPVTQKMFPFDNVITRILIFIPNMIITLLMLLGKSRIVILFEF